MKKQLLMRTECKPYRLTFEVNAIPKGQPRTRTFAFIDSGGRARSRNYDPGTADSFRDAVLFAARRHPDFPATPWPRGVRLSYEAYFPRPKRLETRSSPTGPIRFNSKPDCDNITKAICDALTSSSKLRKARPECVGFPWFDDCQVHSGPQDKFYVHKGHQPGVIITLETLDD